MSVLDPIEDGDDDPNVLQRIPRTPESSMDGLTPAVPDSQATVPWGPADENALADMLKMAQDCGCFARHGSELSLTCEDELLPIAEELEDDNGGECPGLTHTKKRRVGLYTLPTGPTTVEEVAKQK